MIEPNPNNFIWIDLEMTGLNIEFNRIIEIATVVTDSELNILADGPVIAIHQSDHLIHDMDGWNTKHHTESGLVKRVQESKISEIEAEDMTLSFLKEWVPESVSPMCGNSICQDRRFLYRWMPRLEKYFHYRHLDVTTLKILAFHWYPEIATEYSKSSEHRALQDVYDSINELKYYRDHIFKLRNG